MLEQISQPEFWFAAVQVVWANILLSGDNAVVIAVACRRLPRRQRRWGMIVGAGVAALVLILFTGVVSALIRLPYLRMTSAAALIWIAVRLVVAPAGGSDGRRESADDLWQAVNMILAADIIMSLDNVVVVASVADGRYVLVALSLAVSIPIVFAGSAIIMALLERFPVIIWAGGAMIGWIGGRLFVSDPAIGPRLGALLSGSTEGSSHWTNVAQYLQAHSDLGPLALMAGIIGAAIVIVAGTLWKARDTSR